MHVYKEVLSVSIRKGTNICEFAHTGFIYNVQNIGGMIYVYLWVYVCIHRGSKCEHSQAHRHMWVGTQWVHVHKKYPVIWYLYTCEHMHVYKRFYVWAFGRVQTYVSLRITGSCRKSTCDMIHVTRQRWILPPDSRVRTLFILSPKRSLRTGLKSLINLECQRCSWQWSSWPCNWHCS